MKGYKSVIHEHDAHNRGSVMWVKEYYHDRMVRVDDPEDKHIGSEIIHLLLDTLPPTNILGVYQETGITAKQAEEAHRVLRNKVTRCEASGQVCILMGDFNAPINDSAKPLKKAAVNILEWEKTGEIRILNDKQEPTHIPFQKGHQRNCIDMVMITPGLEKKLQTRHCTGMDAC